MKKLFFMAILALFIIVPMSTVTAATIDITVAPAGDVVTDHWWGYFGSGSGTYPGANPNSVSHRYDPGDGYWTRTSLSFNLPALPDPADILSVSLNYNVLSLYDDGDDIVGTFTGGGNVLASAGTGWQASDVTTDFLTRSLGASTIGYQFNYDGYSGFTFGSAEGGDPAFLRITTAEVNTGQNPVPEPATMMLFGIGLLGLAGVNRKKKS